MGSEDVYKRQAVDQAVRMAVAQDPAPQPAAQSASLAAPVLASSSRPAPAPRSRAAAPVQTASAEPAPASSADTDLNLAASRAPKPRSETVILAAMGEGDIGDAEAVEVVSRQSAGGRQWGVNLGRYRSQAEADKLLLQVALQGGPALADGRRHVADTNRGFEANFLGLTKSTAQLVCDRAAARQEPCSIIAP